MGWPHPRQQWLNYYVCQKEKKVQQLGGQTSERLESVVLGLPKTESISAATQWGKEYVRAEVGHRYISLNLDVLLFQILVP